MVINPAVGPGVAVPAGCDEKLHYNARMSRASLSVSLRAVMLLIIVLMQLLSPLLHGHLGTPKQAGLHVHTALSVAVDSHFQSTSFVGGHDWVLTNPEPFEVDVEPAICPVDLTALLCAASAAGISALTFFLLAALACASVSRAAYRPAPIRARWRDRINRPPPAQAPPLLP